MHFLEIFKEQIQKQTFPVIILSFGIYYFSSKVDQLESKIDRCNTEIIALLKSK